MFFGSRLTTVDIGCHSIKVVTFYKRKSNINLLKAKMLYLPGETIIKGKIQDPSIIASKLDIIFKELNYRPKKIVTTIPNQNLLIRNMELPDMSEDELTEAIKWEAEDYLPFSVENASLDFIILNKDKKRTEVLLVAVKKEVIKEYLTPFERLGFKPDVVNVQPMSLISLLTYQGRTGKPVAVIDIGSSSTKVVIGDSNNIYLSRNIDVGGENFTRSIMESRGLEIPEAEDLKIKEGINGLDDSDAAGDLDVELDLLQLTTSGFGNGNFMISQARNLAEEISRSLEFYSIKNRGEIIEDVYVTGGGARLKGLIDIINQELGFQIKSIDPFAGINHHLPGLENKRHEFAVAIGLGISEVLADES